MEVCTIFLLAVPPVCALLCLVDFRVVFEFLPPMALFAVQVVWAATLAVCGDHIAFHPKRAFFWLNIKNCGISSEVLHIVRVGAVSSIVVVGIGAPDRFIVPDIENIILFPLVNQLDGDLTFVVRKRAVVFVLAL